MDDHAIAYQRILDARHRPDVAIAADLAQSADDGVGRDDRARADGDHEARSPRRPRRWRRLRGARSDRYGHAGEMPVSPVSGRAKPPPETAGGRSCAKAACGFGVTRIAMPGGTFSTMSAVQRTAAASSFSARRRIAPCPRHRRAFPRRRRWPRRCPSISTSAWFGSTSPAPGQIRDLNRRIPA